MEGDAGARQLNPDDPTADDEADDDDATERQIGDVPPTTRLTDEARRRRIGRRRPNGRSGSRLDSRGWLVGVCAVLVIAGAALATGGYFALSLASGRAPMSRGPRRSRSRRPRIVWRPPRPRTPTPMAASQQKIIECATGDFSAQATLYSGVLVEAYQAANAQVQVSDMRAAVERHNDDGSMDVLVALRVKLSNSDVQDQEHRLPASGADGAGRRHLQDRPARPGDDVTAVLDDATTVPL